MHKISKAIAMMGLLAPLGASALGVGDIRLHSGLNETFNAEIPLVLSGSDSLKDVKVTLASPDAFTKAGIERQYSLTKLQFAASEKPDGGYVIRVSSREAMREPFLNFLVEVNWPQGKMVREFTVLLDPPASMPEDRYAETVAPVVDRPYRPYVRERAAEISSPEEAAPAPRRTARRAITAVPRQADQAPARSAPSPTADQLSDRAYGPVRSGETLWAIAQNLARESRVSPEQMLAGLYRANPRAFAGSMDALRAGTTLTIPTREYLAQLGPGQASARLASRGSPQPLSRQGEEGANQLKLLAPEEARPQSAPGAGGGETARGKAKTDLALEVAETVRQENDEFRQRLLQLEQKLGEMQRLVTLKDEQIASLRTQQTSAAPPSTTAPKPIPPAAPIIPQPPAAIPPAPAVPTPPAAVTQQPPAVPPPSPAAVPAPQAPPVAIKPPEVPPPVVTAPPRPKPPTPQPAPPPPPAAEEPGLPFDSNYLVYGGGGLALLGLGAWLINRRRNAMIAETESILLAAERESLQSSQPGAAIRASDSRLEPLPATKSSFLSEFTPSDFDALGTEADDVDPISEADVYLAYGRYKQAEELIRYAISQHPERDESKLKLLEIYYATENKAAFESYARELKSEQKDEQPEFWAKVVEMGRELAPGSPLFQGAGQRPQKAKGPEAASSKAYGGLDLSDDLIEDLRRFDISIDDPSSADEVIEIEAASLPTENESGTGAAADLDIASLYAEEFGSSMKEPSAKESIFSFDDLLESEPSFKGEAGRESPALNDARTLEFEPAPPPRRETPPPVSGFPPQDDNGLAFDFEPGKPQPKAAPLATAPDPENFLDFDFGPEASEGSEIQPGARSFDDILRDLGGGSDDGQSHPEVATTPESSSPEQGLGKLGFSLELFEAAPDEEAGPLESKTAVAESSLDGLALESGDLDYQFQTNLSVSEEAAGGDAFADLTDMDQLETKLDLAKAYVDMEDEDSARDILREVITSGNDRQRGEANALMKKLGPSETRAEFSLPQSRTGLV